MNEYNNFKVWTGKNVTSNRRVIDALKQLGYRPYAVSAYDDDPQHPFCFFANGDGDWTTIVSSYGLAKSSFYNKPYNEITVDQVVEMASTKKEIETAFTKKERGSQQSFKVGDKVRVKDSKDPNQGFWAQEMKNAIGCIGTVEKLDLEEPGNGGALVYVEGCGEWWYTFKNLEKVETEKPSPKDVLPGTKIWVGDNQELSDAVQKKLLELGCSWCFSGDFFESRPALYYVIGKGFSVSWGDNEDGYAVNDHGELSLDTLFSLEKEEEKEEETPKKYRLGSYDVEIDRWPTGVKYLKIGCGIKVTVNEFDMVAERIKMVGADESELKEITLADVVKFYNELYEL